MTTCRECKLCRPYFGAPRRGWCDAPIPASAPVQDKQLVVLDAARTCPCFQPKEDEDG